MRLQVHNSHLEFGTYLSPQKELLASWGGYEQHDSWLYRGELRRGSVLTSFSLSFGPEPPSGRRMAIHRSFSDGDPGTAMASFLMDNQGRKSLLITSFTGMEAWQDVDPDNMLYEELVALSEVVGTQSRGLAPELISSLPLSKYVPESPSASNSEKCVICHLEYEGGDIILTLPCKHQYHSDCIKKLA